MQENLRLYYARNIPYLCLTSIKSSQNKGQEQQTKQTHFQISRKQQSFNESKTL